MKVFLNGFGRIGRSVLRAAAKGAAPGLQIVGINDIAAPEMCAYLFEFDSVFGPWPGTVALQGGTLVIDGKAIALHRTPDISTLDLTGVDLVMECTGRADTREVASRGLQAGARRILISGPSQAADLTVVLGANEGELKDQPIVSNASCTTNALAPLARLIDEHWGIVTGSMTTIHCYTGSQPTVDTPATDFARSRAAALSMVPTTTSAERLLDIVLPQIAGRIEGSAVRVPTASVSAVDLAVMTRHPATAEAVNAALATAGGVIGSTTKALVSTDLRARPESIIMALPETRVTRGGMLRVFGWYDNEWGFSNRMLDIALRIGSTVMTLRDFFTAGPYDDGNPVTGHYYEMASNDPGRAQVWAYTGALSYASGDTLTLHAMSSAPQARLTIARDGLTPEILHATTIATGFAETPADCSVTGCGWPIAFEMPIPETWRSGVYTVTLTIPGHRSQHMFVLRAAKPAAKIAMILATGTWCAYNDWGGSNHYQGITGPSGGDFAPHVSLHRPWATGFVRWPDDAPRIPHASPLLSRPRYPHMDYARAKGISKKYASSGWAAFERPFALWCEAQGIALDYLTQHDLHGDPAALSGYARALIVGHDEYWTWEMRDHLEAWLDGGGELARFGGNFFWQTRLSEDLLTQTCFKTTAEVADPLAHTNRLTSYWDHPRAGRPAVATMGLTGSMGVYAGWSRCAAHGSGGFTVYRPDHWVMAGTGLGYGDVLGAASKIFGYEVDGIDYTMTHGLPFAAAGTGLQGDLTLIGLSPATTLAHSTGPHDTDPFIGMLDAEEVAQQIYGRVDAETLGLASRGNGCMALYQRGKGAVFNAASCEWVAGLIARERPVEQVTRTVLTGVWG